MQKGLGAPLRLWSPDDPYLYNLIVTLLPKATSEVTAHSTELRSYNYIPEVHTTDSCTLDALREADAPM